jgi:hypothetical protein
VTIYLLCEIDYDTCGHVGVYGTLEEAQAAGDEHALKHPTQRWLIEEWSPPATQAARHWWLRWRVPRATGVVTRSTKENGKSERIGWELQ